MSDKIKKHVLIVAGEASGELHGANLVRAMKGLNPDIAVTGIGGRRMEEAGVEILTPCSDMAVVGLTEVLSRLTAIVRANLILRSLLKKSPPDLLILIDYPDFNINLARTARRCGVPVLYYISPQVWAWRRGRVRKIAGRVDRMAVILPFEKEFYLNTGAEMIVDYVGHPLIDNVPHDLDKEEIKKELGLGEGNKILGLLPGSREEEVKRLLPSMIDAAEILSSRYAGLKCVLPVAQTISHDLIRSIIGRSSLEIIIAPKDIYRALAVCDMAMVASGTATLEAAIMGVPMIIAYRLSPLSFWVGKMVVKVPYVGLVNLVAGKEVVPEFIQDEVTPQGLADRAISILEDEKTKTAMIKDLKMVKERLGSPGASLRTARIALKMMGWDRTP
ncbi:MAG TPA: lipid-A-disaccharide synthase [Desulfatiglandales bacterium]|nr:lipid-A-disaccharide synthase [Desulfatiglandales bacterium]